MFAIIFAIVFCKKFATFAILQILIAIVQIYLNTYTCNNFANFCNFYLVFCKNCLRNQCKKWGPRWGPLLDQGRGYKFLEQIVPKKQRQWINYIVFGTICSGRVAKLQNNFCKLQGGLLQFCQYGEMEQ